MEKQGNAGPKAISSCFQFADEDLEAITVAPKFFEGRKYRPSFQYEPIALLENKHRTTNMGKSVS